MTTRTPLTAQELAQIVKIGQEITYTPCLFTRIAKITEISNCSITIEEEYYEYTLTPNKLSKCGAKTIDGTPLYHETEQQ